MNSTTRARITIAASILCAACGGATTTTSATTATTTVAQTSEPDSATGPAAARFPVARARLVRQTLPAWGEPEIHVLANGGVAFVSQGFFAVTDEALRIVRRGPADDFDTRGFHGVDDEGRYFVFPNGVFDSLSETTRENPPGRVFAGCEPGLRRCVTLETSDSAWLHVRLEDAIAGTELEAFDITSAAVLGDAATSTLPDLDVPPRAALRGSYLALTIEHANVSQQITYDIGNHAVLASRVESDALPFEWVGTDGTAALLVGQTRVTLVDPRTRMFPPRGSVAGQPIPSASNDDLIVLRTADGFQAYERRTLTAVGDLGAPDFTPVRGPTGTALVTASAVRFLDAEGHETGTAIFETPREFRGPFAYARSGLYLFDAHEGLMRVRANETTVGAALRRERDYIRIATREDAFEATQGGMTFSFSARGLETRAHAEDEEAPSGQGSVGEARSTLLARTGALYAERDLEVFAVAGPERQGAAYAFVERGKVYVIDADGHEVVRPVRLPGNVVRSRCYGLAFITDVDLALYGSAPCIPTRIAFRTGRTTPLGRAYVSIDSTPDGARVAVMADRKIHVFDGRTGATLLSLDPELEHPRAITISDDGQQAQLWGGFGMVVVSLRAVGTEGAEPEVVRYESRNMTYTKYDRRVVMCNRGVLRIIVPFGGSPDVELEVPACAHDRGSEWVAVPGFVATHSSPTGMLFVRLRDGALLEVESVSTHERAAVIVVQGADAVGVVPADTPLLGLRSEDGRSIVTMPNGTDAANDAVRAFFASGPG